MDSVNLVIVIVLIILSALFSGLTLGLMSLSKFALRRKAKLGNQDAKVILPLRENGNLLLITLLLGNVLVNSILAVFLGQLTNGLIAVIVSTSLIVVLGEIVPQAVFHRFALYLGARTAWLTHFFMILFYPITKPLSILLDLALGRERPVIFSKRELLLFFRQQRSHMDENDIDDDEFEILEDALEFSEKKVKNIMNPWNKTFFLKPDLVLGKSVQRGIHASGHSRIPVYNSKTEKVVGVLYSKDLILVDTASKTLVRDVMRRNVQYIRDSSNLDDVLNLFKTKKVHLFVVRDKTKRSIGIITLEDVLEEIVGEITDEYDEMIRRKLKNQ